MKPDSGGGGMDFGTSRGQGGVWGQTGAYKNIGFRVVVEPVSGEAVSLYRAVGGPAGAAGRCKPKGNPSEQACRFGNLLLEVKGKTGGNTCARLMSSLGTDARSGHFLGGVPSALPALAEGAIFNVRGGSKNPACHGLGGPATRRRARH